MGIHDFSKLSIKKKVEKIVYIIRKIQFILNIHPQTENNKIIYSDNLNLSSLNKEFNKLKFYLEILQNKHPKTGCIISKFINTEFYNNLINININKPNKCKVNLYIEELQKLVYELKDVAKIEVFKNDFERINKKMYFKIDNLNNRNYINFEVLCADIRSPFNIGSIIRTAESFGFKKVWLYGISSNIDFKKIFKTSKLAENFIEVEKIKEDKFLYLKNIDYWEYIAGLETFCDSIPINKIKYSDFGKRNLLIVGNEEFGISEFLIKYIDFFINIPMLGHKNSINVASAFSIMAYKILELKLKIN